MLPVEIERDHEVEIAHRARRRADHQLLLLAARSPVDRNRAADAGSLDRDPVAEPVERGEQHHSPVGQRRKV